MSGHVRSASYKVPRADRQWLLAGSCECEDADQPIDLPTDLASWREQLRRFAVDQAKRYTQQSLRILGVTAEIAETEAEATSASARILCGGHQPELFHPGVWFKNRILAAAVEPGEGGRLHADIAINVIIDHDVPRSATIAVPTVKAGRLMSEPVAFADTSPAVAWENLAGEAVRREFAEAVAKAAGSLADTHGLRHYWRDVLRLVDAGYALGAALAAARHRHEREQGWRTLELPMSVLCQHASFGALLGSICERIDEYHAAYNSQLADYRLEHKIDNPVQPVPPLRSSWESAHAYWELPLWISDAAKRERRTAYLVHRDNAWSLSDLEGTEIAIGNRIDASHVAQRWDEISSRWDLRPKALLTTTFLRLLLADQFVHGIGGGAYDRITDGIMATFWDVSPPCYWVATASVFLPTLPRLPEAAGNVRAAQRRLRDMTYQPERVFDEGSLDASPDVNALLSEKRSMLAAIPPRGEKKAWHRRVTEINRKLAAYLAGEWPAARQRLLDAKSEAKQKAIINSREQPFVLYDTDWLLERLGEMSDAAVERSAVASPALQR